MSSKHTSVPGGLMIEGALNLEESDHLLAHLSHLDKPGRNSQSLKTGTHETHQQTPGPSNPLDGNKSSLETLKYSVPSIVSTDPDWQPTHVCSGSEYSYKTGLVKGTDTDLDTPKSGSRSIAPSGTWGRLKADIWLWKLEGLACLISISAMVLLLVGALNYQSSKLANWPYPVNVNSVVSWCVMISKTCMLFSVAECINQLKWRWFRSKNSLAEMDNFDEASRGPWGALTLLLHIRKLHLVSIGALITLFALIMDPLVQTFITAEEVPYISHDANIKYLQHYDHTEAVGAPATTIDNPLRLALIQGLSVISPTLEYSCPGNGICAWDTLSLALCHECQSISHLVTFSDIPSAGTFKLPNGHSLELSNKSGPAFPAWVLLAKAELHNPYSDFGPPNSTVDISILTRTEAYACSVFFCVNAYSTEVSYGLFSENITASWDSRYSHYYNGPMFDLPQNNFSTAFNKSTAYSMGGLAWQTIADGFRDLFNGQYPRPYDEYEKITTIDGFAAMEALSAQNQSASELDSFLSVVANVTNSLSFALRRSPSSEFYTGDSRVMQTLLSVQWKWLALPMAFPVLTLVLLVATIVTSAKDKVPIWKSSQSPLLLYGLSEEIREKHATADTLAEIEADAKGIRVELVDTGAGWRLV